MSEHNVSLTSLVAEVDDAYQAFRRDVVDLVRDAQFDPRFLNPDQRRATTRFQMAERALEDYRRRMYAPSL